jgi:hypothetical protein
VNARIDRGIGPNGPDSYIYTDGDGDDVQVNTRTPASTGWDSSAVVVVSSSNPGGAWLTARQARHLAMQLINAANAAEAQQP